jgi:signal peptidase II
MTPKLRVGLIALLVSLPLDQFTKYLVNTHLTFADRIEVVKGFFYLTHVRNTGAAFGLLADAPEPYRFDFFGGVGLIAIGILISFFRQLAPGDRLSALSLGFILGGALGNLIDRWRFGEVVDFLHFKLWGGYSWPDFNLADTFIVVGVALLVLELIAHEGENRASSEDAKSTP